MYQMQQCRICDRVQNRHSARFYRKDWEPLMETRKRRFSPAQLASLSAMLVSICGLSLLIALAASATAAEIEVAETDDEIRIVTGELEASVRKKGYVSGIKAQSFLDKKSGFRDAG